MSESVLWVNEKKRRYYRVWVYQDLLNDWVLLRMWGSLDSSRGGEKKELISSHDEGLSKLCDIHKRRISRHYDLVGDTASKQWFV